MNDDPSAAHVLYTKVQPDKALDAAKDVLSKRLLLCPLPSVRMLCASLC
jgi:hypothetical protein